MSSEARWTFLVLLPEPHDRERLALLLRRVTLPSARKRVDCLAPPKGGKEFFASDREMTDWETRVVPSDSRRVYLLMHDPELNAIATQHENDVFYIGVAGAEQARSYERLPHVTAFVAGSPLAFVPRLLRDWGDTPEARDVLFAETETVGEEQDPAQAPVRSIAASTGPDAPPPSDLQRELEHRATVDLLRELQRPYPSMMLPATSLVSDIWTVEDTLGYRSFAEAVAEFIRHRETVPPLTIGVRAPWGAGKTSVMRMIRDALDPASDDGQARRPITITSDQDDDGRAPRVSTILRKAKGRAKPAHFRADMDADQRITVWFNPWMYQTGEQIWAGLAKEIITQVTERMDAEQREAFWLEMSLRRLDREAIRRAVYRVLLRRLVLVSEFLAAAIVAAVALVLASASRLLSSTVLGIGGGLSIVVGLVRYIKLRREPARDVLSNLVQWRDPMQADASDAGSQAPLSVAEPAYTARAGFLQFVHSDVRAVLDLVAARDRPIVVFIDDLDRCSPRVVAQVIEAVNAFLAGAYSNCVFVIAMEPLAAVASIEVAYRQLLRGLKPLEADGPSLGWRFLDKLVQLPLQLPSATRDVLPAFLASFERKPDGAIGPEEPAQLAGVPGTPPRDEGTTGAPADEGAIPLGSLTSRETLVTRLDQAATSLDAISDAAKALMADKAAPDEEIVQAATELFDRRFHRANRDVDSVLNRELDMLTVINGREVKRFVNLFRFYAVIGARRRLQGFESATISEAATLAAMASRWPDIVGVAAERSVLNELRAATVNGDFTPPERLKDFPRQRLLALAGFLQADAHELSPGAFSLLVG